MAPTGCLGLLALGGSGTALAAAAASAVAAAGLAALCETEWFESNRKVICENREYTTEALRALGFTVLNSKTNFLFAKSEKISGKALYEKLKARGVLVRHFNGERIKEFVRITIGTKEQMEIFLAKTQEIIQEEEA